MQREKPARHGRQGGRPVRALGYFGTRTGGEDDGARRAALRIQSDACAPAAKPGEWWADATRFAHPDNDVLTPVSTLAVRAEWHGQSPRMCLAWQSYVCDKLAGKSPEHITTTYSAEQQRWIRTAMQLRKERTAARVVQSREFIPSELDEELAEAEA
jgi:hypothetical protein